MSVQSSAGIGVVAVSISSKEIYTIEREMKQKRGQRQYTQKRRTVGRRSIAVDLYNICFFFRQSQIHYVCESSKTPIFTFDFVFLVFVVVVIFVIQRTAMWILRIFRKYVLLYLIIIIHITMMRAWMPTTVDGIFHFGHYYYDYQVALSISFLCDFISVQFYYF